MLKRVTLVARRFVDEQPHFSDGHRLDVLWTMCRPVLLRIWDRDPAFDEVAGVIEKLVQIDPAGEAFRYPIGTLRKGARAPTLPPTLRHLDLAALVADVGRALDLLDGADTGIDVYQGWKDDAESEAALIQAEMAAEMREEYEPGDW